MASIKQHKDGWRAFIFKQGVRKSKVFITKTAAAAWARQMEIDIENGILGKLPNKKFSDLLEKYLEVVSAKKAGKKWEKVRIDNALKMEISKVSVSNLNSTHVAEWRDKRLETVSNSTVLREWNLLSHVCSIAIVEWKWLLTNPFKEVQRPKAPEARWRRISDAEIGGLLIALGYDFTQPKTITARIGAAFLFSIESALRAGELCALTWNHVHDRHIHIPKSKNGFKRDVPLSKEARRLLDELPKDAALVFNLTCSQIDSLFRKAKAMRNIEGLHWHDTRHEALTRLSKKLNVMELAKIAGIRDLRILQNVYYNPSIGDLADKFN
jgi:integrase